MHASDRVIFKEAYARASRYNQTIHVYDERNGNGSARSESTENEEDGPSDLDLPKERKLMMSPRHTFFSSLFFAQLYLILE